MRSFLGSMKRACVSHSSFVSRAFIRVFSPCRVAKRHSWTLDPLNLSRRPVRFIVSPWCFARHGGDAFYAQAASGSSGETSKLKGVSVVRGLGHARCRGGRMDDDTLEPCTAKLREADKGAGAPGSKRLSSSARSFLYPGMCSHLRLNPSPSLKGEELLDHLAHRANGRQPFVGASLSA